MRRGYILREITVALMIAMNALAGQDAAVGKLSRDLRSQTWTVRQNAVEKLTQIPNWARDPEIRKALVDTLAQENSIVFSSYRDNHPVAEKYGEDYDDLYVSKLIETVMQFASKPSEQHALDVLVHSAYNSDSRLAEWLGAQGDAVVPSVMNLAHGDLDVERSQAAGVIGQLLRADRPLHAVPVSQENQLKLKQEVRKAARDGSVIVRWDAVHSLGIAADPEDMRLLYEIAGSDPTVDHDSSSFPIREEAQRSLEKIRQRQSNPSK